MDFREGVANDFGVIFDSQHEGNEDAIATVEHAEQWNWYGVMYRLAGGQIINLEAVTRLNLFECLTWLTYETDLESQNKVKYGGNQ